jgi:hypothetical protein
VATTGAPLLFERAVRSGFDWRAGFARQRPSSAHSFGHRRCDMAAMGFRVTDALWHA